MTYPATNFEEAVSNAITSSDQLHQVINGSVTDTVTTDSGEIPSVRKALTDNMYFVEAIPWVQGSNETVFNQLRKFTDNAVYWAPTATVSNPVPMGVTPDGDSNWTLAPVSLTEEKIRQTAAQVCSNSNLLSNHNFARETPDTTQPKPNGTPRNYPAGYQVFAGWYADDSAGVTGLTYSNGFVNFTAGTIYQIVPKSNALAFLTTFTASLAGKDGLPSTANVSFTDSGTALKVVITATASNVFSVKLQEGKVADLHGVWTAKGDKFQYNSVTELKGGAAPVGSICSSGAADWIISKNQGMPLDSGLFAEPLTPIHLIDFDLQYYKDLSSDDTSKVIEAAGLAKSYGKTLVLPPKKVGVTSFEIFNVIDFHIHSDNCELVGLATTPTESMFVAKDWVHSEVTGTLRFTGNENYQQCFDLLSDTTGTTKNAFYNLVTLYTPHGVRIGRADIDLINSENTFYNLNAFECPTHVRGGGSQTGASFVGCNLLGVPRAPLPGAEIHALWLEGGFWTVVGGEVLTTQSASDQCIKMTPHDNATPDYPQLRISGAQIETASPLLSIENPGGLTINPNGQGGQFCITESGGYCGGAAVVNANFISATSDFRGKIQVKNNNFYAGNARNAFNISVGDNAVVETDKSSWGRNFRDWIGGCNGGKLRHNNELVAGAFNDGGETYNIGVKTAIKFGNKYVQARYSRYNQHYDLSTGVFTVPAGGIDSLKVELGLLASGLNGALFLEVDGVQVAYGITSGSSGNLVAVIESLSEGQTVTPYLQTSSAAVTLTNGKFNFISFTASN